jgi:hypothetical protein
MASLAAALEQVLAAAAAAAAAALAAAPAAALAAPPQSPPPPQQQQQQQQEQQARALVPAPAVVRTSSPAPTPTPAPSPAVKEKRVPQQWSERELRALHAAVAKFGRDWDLVSAWVGSTRSNQDCISKVKLEVKSGRMTAPAGKRPRSSWSTAELEQLEDAVAQHGRSWAAVAKAVGRTSNNCRLKYRREEEAGRIAGQDRVRRVRWTERELELLRAGLAKYGRNWERVSAHVGSNRSAHDCCGKIKSEVVRGRMAEPAGKILPWSDEEVSRLIDAVQRHRSGSWDLVAKDVSTRSAHNCRCKFYKERKRVLQRGEAEGEANGEGEEEEAETEPGQDHRSRSSSCSSATSGGSSSSLGSAASSGSSRGSP